MTKYPALTQFVSCYLHQDWPEDYPDVWGAVDDFATEPEDAPNLPAEIRALLATDPSEAELRSLVVEDLDGNYRPEIHGETFRSWLTAVAERVEQKLNG